MCLIAFSWLQHARYALVLGANRDEFRARPSAAAKWWDAPGEILAGRDLSAGGTWLGVTRQGRFAALTNIRNPAARHHAQRSRGELVVDALRTRPVADKAVFAGYNLLRGELSQHLLEIDGNRPDQQARRLAAGLYGLSNGGLNEPWPKTEVAKDGIARLLQGASPEPETLIDGILDLLASRRSYDDAALPDTGIGLERERRLSPLFIDLDDYGTRCSSVILLEHSGRLHLVEQNHDGLEPARRSYCFELQPALAGP